VKGVAEDCPTRHGKHPPTCMDKNPISQNLHPVNVFVSVRPGPHWMQAPPDTELSPTMHCVQVPLTSWKPALQSQCPQPTPLHELALQPVHSATLPCENLPAAQLSQPDLASFTRWPAGHTSVHVAVRVVPP